MSSISQYTIYAPLNTIQAEISTRIYKILKFFYLLCIRNKRLVERPLAVLHYWGNVQHPWGTGLPICSGGMIFPRSAGDALSQRKLWIPCREFMHNIVKILN
jgi:hypothetical protein